MVKVVLVEVTEGVEEDIWIWLVCPWSRCWTVKVKKFWDPQLTAWLAPLHTMWTMSRWTPCATAWPTAWVTPLTIPWQTKIVISGQFCNLAMFNVSAQNPCTMRWKVTLVAFGFFSIHDIFWKNVTTQNKQPYSIVPGPSMAGRPSVEQPLWYFCTKINWWQ